MRGHGAVYSVLIDDRETATGLSRIAVAELLEGHIALQVAASAPQHIFIHAGVIAHRGRALVLPGRSFAGKSTLVERLVGLGAIYYSDEYAVLDEQGLVHPYPRPMSIRVEGGAPRRLMPPKRGRRPLQVGWVIGARYEPSATKAELKPLSRGRTALLLMDNAVAARVAPTRVLPTLRAALVHASGASGVRGEAQAAAQQILADCV